MPRKYKSEIDVITEMYSKLSDLPIELMRPALKTAKLIGAAHKAKIDKKSDRDAAMYILDEVIIKSLQIDIPDKFDTFVKVLIEFDDDNTAVVLGRQLMEKLPSDSQARIQQKLLRDQSQRGPPPGGFPQLGYLQHQPHYQQPVCPQPGYSKPAGYHPQQPGYQSYPPKQPGYQGHLPQQPDYQDYPPKQPGYQGYPPQQSGYQGYPPQQPDYLPFSPMPDDVMRVETFLKDSGHLGTSQYAADDPKTNAVCRIRNGEMMGTGWVASLTLEGRKVTVLLTNNHVLGKLETACSADTEYQFAYLYKNSEMNPAVIYGDKLIPNNPKDFYTCGQQDRKGGILLDYTLVKVYDKPLIDTKLISGLDGQKRSIYDCRFDLDNITEPASVTQAETITIHHHPKGDILKKSSQGSLSVGYLLCYWCDTDEGSSGAPIVKVKDEEPRVIALHRGGRVKGVTIKVNFGTLITAVLDDVKGKMPSNLMNIDEVYDYLAKTVKPLMP